MEQYILAHWGWAVDLFGWVLAVVLPYTFMLILIWLCAPLVDRLDRWGTKPKP